MKIRTVFFDIGDTLVNGKQWIPGAKEAIQALKRKGLRVGVISNTGNFDRNSIGKLLPPDFDFGVFDEKLIILSGEVGVAKPDLPIYLLAIDRASVSPRECIFVGEKAEETLAAQLAGMLAFRLADPTKDLKALAKLLK